MGFERVLQATATLAAPDKLDAFSKHVDPRWIEEALEATGTATVRRRRLPAEQVVWLVVGMAMYRDRPIEDVVTKLDLALPSPTGPVARSSIAQARQKLGSEPLRWLFERCAETWTRRSADAHRWRGLALYGIDGSSIRIPDSPDNRNVFGGQKARGGTQSGYPLARIAVLMVLRSHLLAGAEFGPYAKTSELEYARPLIDKIPSDSLTILDRGFYSASFLLDIAKDENRHWLVRVKSNVSARTIAKFGTRDELVELDVSRHARKEDPLLPKTFQARLIRYKRDGYPEVLLLTSLTDPKRYPRDEIVALYHERWELELGYDELKTELLEREEAIRSRKPDGVRQELWGILLAYNLVRLEMEDVAREAKVEPTRVSFIFALRLIRDEWLWLAVTSPGAIPKRLAELRRNLKLYILPPRRSERKYPRAVKIKMSNYARKRPVAAK